METLVMGGSHWRLMVYGYMNGNLTPAWWGSLGLTPLWLAAHVYRGVVEARSASYTYGLRHRQQLPCRVISIGNLTLGGTGKTTLTIWMARWYQQHGWRVAVLSRGYGAHMTTPFCVVSAGAGPLLDWRAVGDEPYLLAGALPGVPVLIGKNRYQSGRYACDHFGTQVVILDDGFQHYALQRDLDIVLLDASNPFGHGTLLPRGTLREPWHALRRANAIMLTRVEMAEQQLPTLCQQLRRWRIHQPVYGMTMEAEALCQGETCIPDGLTRLRQRRVVAFAGIGNPQAFASTLAQLGSDVVALLVFPDHHPYTAADWHTIVDLACQRQAECLVTTEKDAVRLASAWQAPIPVYALRIGVRFVQGHATLQQQLQTLVQHAQTHT
ncbi:MAG TPA: tetraacyldisaccharide 4'-kinase [Candidatus Tectomicrobia bacterium]